MTAKDLLRDIDSGAADTIMRKIYSASFDAPYHRSRAAALIERHDVLFGSVARNQPRVYSVPGRTELGGNHTDHNNGIVLAASVNLDTIAAVTSTENSRIIIDSIGFDPVVVDLPADPGMPILPDNRNFGTTASLVLGIAEAFRAHGYRIGGFVANTATDVRKGSGLSSSAAIEITIAVILNDLYNDNAISAVDLARFSKFAENTFFGKPSGLMDQTACAYGGIIGIDFMDPAEPIISDVSFSFHDAGYTLMVVDTGGNHADLTPDYAAVPAEMKSVAAFFGRKTCRDITVEEVLENAPQLRRECGDRAVLRALHFLGETERAARMHAALRNHSMKEYLQLVQASGNSSAKFLQNAYAPGNPREQGITLGLAVTEDFLGDDGACRVHGGGFAGTIQAFIPNERAATYRELMHGIFGRGSVDILTIRNVPAERIL